MPEFINLKLMAHPLNWAIVWATLLIAATAYTYMHDGVMDATNNVIPD